MSTATSSSGTSTSPSGTAAASGGRVAVLGGGPAGLAAAFQLSCAGVGAAFRVDHRVPAGLPTRRQRGQWGTQNREKSGESPGATPPRRLNPGQKVPLTWPFCGAPPGIRTRTCGLRVPTSSWARVGSCGLAWAYLHPPFREVSLNPPSRLQLRGGLTRWRLCRLLAVSVRSFARAFVRAGLERVAHGHRDARSWWQRPRPRTGTITTDAVQLSRGSVLGTLGGQPAVSVAAPVAARAAWLYCRQEAPRRGRRQRVRTPDGTAIAELVCGPDRTPQLPRPRGHQTPRQD